MDYSDALREMKKSKLVARGAWWPEGFWDQTKTPRQHIYIEDAHVFEMGGGKRDRKHVRTYAAHFVMFIAGKQMVDMGRARGGHKQEVDGVHQPGYVPTVTDQLADDWFVVE